MTIPRFTAHNSRALPTRRLSASSESERLPMRRYHALWQTSDGNLHDREQVAPALPLFDAAHSAFARGTLITTTRGPVAVEDLLPGDRLPTTSHGALPVIWIGKMTLQPESDPDRPVRLTRIMADAFGIARPMTDMLAGPGARILTRPRGLRANIGSDHVLTPAHAMADGMHAFCVSPPRAVTLYHICLRRHATITANGLEAESFHPGAGFEREIGPKMLGLFLGLFPHIHEPHQFGPLAHLRLPLDAPDTLSVA
ncbi:Hint domain-containing protein [uncultured Roseovarius sp.]|uniref:Hint domain-containing protein n=1 Tax=uncultured Roseovarius sp. TaxID=293344 RepID=UPI002608D9DE|nr:Hint domain-containing protein [uncultured Roseovarius sp.]